ncbi:hypothetical protein ACFLYF_02670 [Chloroflexota bacterium]
MLNNSSNLPSGEDKDSLIDDIRKSIGNRSNLRDEKRLKLQRIVLKESEKIDSRIEDFREHLNKMLTSDPKAAQSLIRLLELKNTIKESLLGIYDVSKRLL